MSKSGKARMYQLTEREIWRRYRNREHIPVGFLCSFAADNHEVWYGDFEIMRISYDGLWALYFDSQWHESGKSMRLVTVAFTDQLVLYFEKLGVSTEVLKPLTQLRYPTNCNTTSRNIEHPILDHKASPFCKKNDGFYRNYLDHVVKELPYYVDSFYLTDLINAHDLKEEILIKTGEYSIK